MYRLVNNHFYFFNPLELNYSGDENTRSNAGISFFALPPSIYR